MFTLGLMYIYLYISILISLLILSFLQVPVCFLTQISVSNYWIFLQKYNITKGVNLFLMFSLTALPPVGLFFIKFNILSLILYQVHFYTLICIFFLFLLSMFFYSQIFNVKNYKKSTYALISTETFLLWSNSNFTANFNSYTTFKFTLFIVLSLCFLIIFIALFNDFFSIISL